MVSTLREYKRKRDFNKTPEPLPKIRRDTKKHIFVIQEHHASHLHYDFRLEMGGVLKSWAVPKGPSLDPAIKRLAALTEDHPLDYATFEGIIPEGYGAGTVIVWDTGTYENSSEKNGKPLSMAEAFKKGHIKFVLHGKKLKGGFALIRFYNNNKNWLLIKLDDEYADAHKDLVTTQTRSVLSRKTINGLDRKFKR